MSEVIEIEQVREFNFPMVNNDRLYYIGGFFDGEGSVSLTVAKRYGAKVGYQFCPFIDFSQKNRDILEWIADFLEVKRIIVDNGGGNYMLRVCSSINVYRLSGILKRYCVLKKRQLVLMERASEIISSRGNWFYTKDQLQELLCITKELRTLNNKTKNQVEVTDLDEVERAIEANYNV